MGMYTEIRINCKLKNDAPKEVINILIYLATGEDFYKKSIPDHEFFKSERWEYIFRMTSAYFDDERCSAVVKWGDHFRILSVSNLKNYDHEIQKFLEWLYPYVDAEPNEIFAKYRYEESEDDTLISLSSFQEQDK